MNYTPEQIAAIAAAFTKGLQAELTATSWSELLSRHSADTAHCPSHDYCDANMVMMEAIESILGPQDWIKDDDSEADFALNDAWNAAWTKSRQSWGRV